MLIKGRVGEGVPFTAQGLDHSHASVVEICRCISSIYYSFRILGGLLRALTRGGMGDGIITLTHVPTTY